MSEMRELKACPFCASKVIEQARDHNILWIEHVEDTACPLVEGLWATEAYWNNRPLVTGTTEEARTLSTSLDQEGLVEKVARTIEEVIWPLTDWDGDRAVAADAADKAARAALLAIREGVEE